MSFDTKVGVWPLFTRSGGTAPAIRIPTVHGHMLSASYPRRSTPGEQSRLPTKYESGRFPCRGSKPDRPVHRLVKL